jgi:uncharacterized protein
MTGTKKETAWLKAPSPGGEEFVVPVATVTGASDGPRVVIVAGVHGSEYVGMQSVIRLFNELDPKDVSGTVVCVPMANLPAFYGRAMHVCPIDGLNLGRAFPGNPTGSYTEGLGNFIWTRIVEGADYVLDMHGGDLEEELSPYVSFAATGNPKVDRASQALAEAFDAPAILRKGRPEGDAFVNGGLYDCAAYHGIPSMLAEAGSHGQLDYAILEQNHFHGLINVLRHVGVISGEVVRLRTPLRLKGFVGVRYDQDGVFYPVIAAGQTVHTGQRLGQLRDLFGEAIADIDSPCEALVLGVITTPPMPASSLMVGLGEFA